MEDRATTRHMPGSISVSRPKTQCSNHAPASLRFKDRKSSADKHRKHSERSYRLWNGHYL